MNRYYLYRYIRLDKNEPFYVGIGTKTKDDIKYGTYTRSTILKKRNSIWGKIISKTNYKIEILYESDNYDFIKQKEVEFIKLYGRIDLNTGILSNMTDGGEGTKSVVVSVYSRNLRSLALTGKKQSKESLLKRTNTRARNNFRHSEESKKKISLSKATSILQFSLQGALIKDWENTLTPAKDLSISRFCISQCANTNNRKSFTAGNYIWVYKQDYINNNLNKFKTALERVSNKKVRTAISTFQKEDIAEEYMKICKDLKYKKERLLFLSEKYKVNYNTIRAIVYML